MTADFKIAIKPVFSLVFFMIGVVLFGCTGPAERLHPRCSDLRNGMGTLLVVTPEIAIFDQLPDGSRLFDPELSLKAQLRAQQAIVQELQDRHFSAAPIDTSGNPPADLQSVITLFRSVNRSIQLHTIGPQLFPSKRNAFEYHLGPVADILQAYNADGLVLAMGHQTGSDRPSKNWLSIAVVEPEGRIIWYGLQGDHERFNIQNSDGVHTLVASTMTHFWERGL